MVKLAKIFDKVVNFADRKLGRLLDRTAAGTIVFPTEIEEIGQFMMFSIFREFKFQRDAFDKATIDARIFLPLPANLTAGYGANYGNEELGVFGNAVGKNFGDVNFDGSFSEAVSELAKFSRNVRADIGEEGVKNVGASVAQSEAGPVIAGLIGSVLGPSGAVIGAGAAAAAGAGVKAGFAGKGTARNPHMAVLFQGTGFRTHSFNYKLIPRNQEDSRTITQIIKSFKLAMVPEYIRQNHFFRYPQQFRIEVSKPDHLFKFQTCVLTAFNVNYHGEGGAFYHSLENGEEAPVSVTLEMTFTETRIITKDEIEEGL